MSKSIVGRVVGALVIVYLLGALPAWGAPPREEVTDEQVGQAIAKMQTYLYSQQDAATGTWGEDGQRASGHAPGGVTALVVASLLFSGESSQRPEIDRALKYLRSPAVEQLTVYQVSMRAHVLAHLPASVYSGALENDARWLAEAAHDDTTYGYLGVQVPKAIRDHWQNGGTDWWDHSVTQYGILGLWEASKCGIRVAPSGFWEKVIDHWVEAQKGGDGGWRYQPSQAETGSMTSAGLTVLLVAQQEILRGRSKPDPKVTAALDKGLKWMDEHFTMQGNPGGGPYVPYYRYGVERVALASGRKYFGKEDWFRSGAQFIVRRMSADGDAGGLVDTAFSLMFLSRGRVPLWITKAQLSEQDWNDRPNDLYFLNQFMSAYREGEVNWQVLALDRTTAEELRRSTPILYLSSDTALHLTPPQEELLKRYLDLGGLLWANAENGSSEFQESIKALAAKFYPQYRGVILPPTHLLYRAEHVVPAAGEAVWGLSNGSRDLILMPLRDWGLHFQSDPDRRSNLWKLGANLFVMATDRGVLENRLVDRFEVKIDRPATGKLLMGRARYQGNWLPEPLAWEPLATRLFNRSSLTLTVSPAGDPQAATQPAATAAAPADPATAALDLAALGTCDCKLVHLTGVDTLTLTPEQLAGIKTYIERGGTILIENVGGGHGEFSLGLERQLEAALGKKALKLQDVNPDDPILSGQGLNGGYDIRTLTFRRYAAWESPLIGTEPRLNAFFLGRRPAIVLSHYDLSQGMLDIRHWGINGYTPEVSRQIMTNLVLWANSQTLHEPGWTPPAPGATTAPSTTLPATAPAAL